MKAFLRSISMLVWVWALVLADGVGGMVACSTGFASTTIEAQLTCPSDWMPDGNQGRSWASFRSGSSMTFTFHKEGIRHNGLNIAVVQIQDTWLSCMSSKMSKSFSSGQCKYIWRTTSLKRIQLIWMTETSSTNPEAGLLRSWQWRYTMWEKCHLKVVVSQNQTLMWPHGAPWQMDPCSD